LFTKELACTNRALTPQEIVSLAQKLGKVYWDSLVCEGASLEDIDEEKVRWYLRKAKLERRLEIDENVSVEEALKRLGLIVDDKLTNAAILLFGKNPQRFFYQAETRCARFKGTKPIEFTDMKVFGGTLIEQVENAVSFVLDHIPMRVVITGKPEREEIYEYPPFAIREAIVNAICHRDYTIMSNVQVRIFDDRIEVWGCGPLPEPLTLEDLKKEHKSIPRNPLISKCFFLIKFIEQWGTGTNRMIEACLKHGLPEPLFEYVARDFVVIFRKYRVTEEVMKKLNERQKKAIEHLRVHKRITLSEYRELIPGITEKTAYRDLKGMEKLGLIKGIGKKKGRYYVLV
jgi:ATP-dependent DNA helicase RecG